MKKEAATHTLKKDSMLPANFPLRVIRRSPQPPYPLHDHEFSELVIILSGEGFHHLPGSRSPLHPGDVFVLNGRQVHGFTDLRNLHLINLIYDPIQLLPHDPSIQSLPGFQLLFDVEPKLRQPQRQRTRLQLNALALSKALHLISNMEQELAEGRHGYETVARAKFHLLVTMLARNYSEHIPHASIKHLHRFAETLGYIEHHIQETMSLNDLAERASMSVSHFIRIFRQVTGQPPLQYILTRRLLRAREELKDPSESIAEISRKVGIEDPNYFSRQFRKHFGESPRQYRKLN